MTSRAILADPAASARLGRGPVDPALVREALGVVTAWGDGQPDGPDGASRETLARALRLLRRYDGGCFLDAEEKRDVHRAVALVVLRMWELGLARSAVRGAVTHRLEFGDLPHLRERAEASGRGDLFDEGICDAMPSWGLLLRDPRSLSVVFDALDRRQADGGR